MPYIFLDIWYCSAAKKFLSGETVTRLTMIYIGYIFGIVSKIMSPSFKWYMMFFYVLNLIVVGADIVLHVINYYREESH